jgi:hypothetical protein
MSQLTDVNGFERVEREHIYPAQQNSTLVMRPSAACTNSSTAALRSLSDRPRTLHHPAQTLVCGLFFVLSNLHKRNRTEQLRPPLLHDSHRHLYPAKCTLKIIL